MVEPNHSGNADSEVPQPAKSAARSESPQKAPSPDQKESGKGSSPRPDVVVFRNVSKSFGPAHQSKVAIQDISFVVEDAPNVGELVPIVGPSGCGKSTLLRIIAALKPHFPPTSGEVQVLGRPVHEPGPDRGLVDQKYSLLPHLNVIENVAFGLKLRGVARKERRDQAREWVKKVGLEGCDDKYPSEL